MKFSEVPLGVKFMYQSVEWTKKDPAYASAFFRSDVEVIVANSHELDRLLTELQIAASEAGSLHEEAAVNRRIGKIRAKIHELARKEVAC